MYKPRGKKLIIPALISLAAALLFTANPLFAQTPPVPASQKQKGQTEELGTANDFDNDVQNGKDELKHDPEAQRHQNEVVDGEDGEAGEGDGQNNQEGINEYGDIEQAKNNQGVNEDNQDINNSGVDEVEDANNLDEQSQEVINEHQVQEEDEVENEKHGGKETPGQGTSNQESGSSTEQNQPEQNNNQ